MSFDFWRTAPLEQNSNNNPVRMETAPAPEGMMSQPSIVEQPAAAQPASPETPAAMNPVPETQTPVGMTSDLPAATPVETTPTNSVAPSVTETSPFATSELPTQPSPSFSTEATPSTPLTTSQEMPKSDLPTNEPIVTPASENPDLSISTATPSTSETPAVAPDQSSPNLSQEVNPFAAHVQQLDSAPLSDIGRKAEAERNSPEAVMAEIKRAQDQVVKLQETLAALEKAMGGNNIDTTSPTSSPLPVQQPVPSASTPISY